MDAADAFVIVTPEYNHGMSAPVKNALDFLHEEWRYKPVGFVAYGGVSAGTRAANMLKEVVTALRMTPVTDAVTIPFFRQFVDDEEGVQANETMETSADALLEELVRLGGGAATAARGVAACPGHGRVWIVRRLRAQRRPVDVRSAGSELIEGKRSGSALSEPAPRNEWAFSSASRTLRPTRGRGRARTGPAPRPVPVGALRGGRDPRHPVWWPPGASPAERAHLH